MPKRLESTFCTNFKCCGQALANLHDLLQHYEERHVKFEDDDVPAMVADDEVSSPSSASSSQPSSPKAASSAAGNSSSSSSSGPSNVEQQKKQVAPIHTRVNSSDIDTFEESSAFDTAVMRSPMSAKGKKRSFGQFSNGNNNTHVHQSLRRALIDGGVGRGTSGRSSVYSANSPFSTPGSSIPGTPILENDQDAAFFGSNAHIPAFSSLSIRGNGNGAGNDDHDLPSCAPPNLFFPASGTSSSASTSAAGAPPAKRERVDSFNSNTAASSIAGALENSLASPGSAADRPYKCLTPGCDKAYKQMNGLKYHRLHGQCNQNTLPPQQQISAVVNGNAHGTPNSNQDENNDDKMKTDSPAASSPKLSSAASTTAPPPSSSSSPTTASANAASASASTSAAPATAPSVRLSVATTAAPPPSPVTVTESPSSTPSCSAPSSPRSSIGSLNGTTAGAEKPFERVYICQVGNCGKRYKNLNGLRYHYLHSGSHGLLGLQLLHSNGGGASARADSTTGRPAVSTNDLSSAALAAAAQAAAAQQQAQQRTAAAAAAAAAAATAASPSINSTPATELSA